MSQLAHVPMAESGRVPTLGSASESRWPDEPDTLDVVRHAVVVRHWTQTLRRQSRPHWTPADWMRALATLVSTSPSGALFVLRGTQHFVVLSAVFDRRRDVLTPAYIRSRVDRHFAALWDTTADVPPIGWTHADGHGQPLAMALVKLLAHSAFREVRMQFADDLHRDILAIMDLRNGALLGVPGRGGTRDGSSYAVLADLLAAEVGCRLVSLLVEAARLGMPYQIAVGVLAVLFAKSTDKDRPLYNGVAKGVYLAGLETPPTGDQAAFAMPTRVWFGTTGPVAPSGMAPRSSIAVLSTQHPVAAGTTMVEVLLDAQEPSAQIAVTVVSTLMHRLLQSMHGLVAHRRRQRAGHESGEYLIQRHPEAARLAVLHAKRLACVSLFRVINSRRGAPSAPSTFVREALRTQARRPTAGPYGVCGADVLELMRRGRCALVGLAVTEAISLVAGRLAQPSRLRSFPGSELAHVATHQFSRPGRTTERLCGCKLRANSPAEQARILARTASRCLADVLQALRRSATRHAWGAMVRRLADEHKAAVTLPLLRAMYRTLPPSHFECNLALHFPLCSQLPLALVLARRYAAQAPALPHLPAELWQLVGWQAGVDFSARCTLLRLIGTCTSCGVVLSRNALPGQLPACARCEKAD